MARPQMQREQLKQPIKPERRRVADVASGMLQRFQTDYGETDREVLPANVTGTLPKSLGLIYLTETRHRHPTAISRQVPIFPLAHAAAKAHDPPFQE